MVKNLTYPVLELQLHPTQTTMMEEQTDSDDLKWTAEVTYAKNPVDTENLIKWGSGLRKLSTSENVDESKTVIKYAIWKLHTALFIDPQKHQLLWCMGSALRSLAILTPHIDSTKRYFDSACTYFQKAIDEDPGNELYQKSFEEATKAMESHLQAMASRAAPSSYAKVLKGLKSPKNRALRYDICGWIILYVSIVGWIRVAKNNVPPTQ